MLRSLRLPPSVRYRSLGVTLVMLALLAQLWMQQLSTRHLAAMAMQAFWQTQVCFVHTSDVPAPLEASDTETHPASAMQHCPVCSVAVTGFLVSTLPSLRPDVDLPTAHVAVLDLYLPHAPPHWRPWPHGPPSSTA